MSDEAPSHLPAPPAALADKGLVRAEDSVGDGRAVAVPGSLIFQFFGPELMARYRTDRDEKGEAADG